MVQTAVCASHVNHLAIHYHPYYSPTASLNDTIEIWKCSKYAARAPGGSPGGQTAPLMAGKTR